MSTPGCDGRIGRLVSVALSAAMLAGCDGLVMSRAWTMDATRPDGRSYTVEVRDLSGRIRGITVDPPGFEEMWFANPAGEPNVAIVPWTGGACDTRTRIEIRNVDAGPGLTLSVRTDMDTGGCDALGVGHALRLEANGPLPIDQVLVHTVAP